METVYSLKTISFDELKDIVSSTLTTSIKVIDKIQYANDYVIQHDIFHLGAGILTEKYLVYVCPLSKKEFLDYVNQFQ